MVQNAIEKIINDTVKLPIIMELLIKNKGIKSSEYCFNKDFFIIVLTMLNMCQHSLQSTTISTQVKKTKSKQPNEKTKLKKTTKKINNLLQQLSLLFLSSCISFSTTFTLSFVSILFSLVQTFYEH